jgi:hypothetical protein
VLVHYWEAAIRAGSYLYISNVRLRNLEEPGWMFEHLQLVLNANYKFLLEFVCIKGLKQEVTTSVCRHFLNATYKSLLQPLIERRLEEDLPNLN